MRPAITLRRLHPDDADDVAAVVAVAVAGALPREVMPPDARPDPDEWTLVRERAYARFLREPPAAECAWLVVEGVVGGGEVVGVARLSGYGGARLEAAVWLVRSARGRDIAPTALRQLLTGGEAAARVHRRPRC